MARKKNCFGSPLVRASEKKIRVEGNRAKSIQDLMYRLGYEYGNPGSNTINRFRNILGEPVYHNIASGRRKQTPRTRWIKN